MLKQLILSYAGFLISVSTAQACTSAPSIDQVSGRSYHWYRGVNFPKTQDLLAENQFIAIVKTQLIEQYTAEYVDYTVNILQHELVKTLHGNIRDLPDGHYIDVSQNTSSEDYIVVSHDTLKTTKQNNGLNFQFWESLKIPSPKMKMVIKHDDCDSARPQLNLQPNSLYLTFGYIWEDGSIHISDAIKLESKRDPIVKAFRSFVNNDANAPNKMSAETYFKNMSAFAEVSIHKCPGNSDFLYEDSQFTKTEDQIDELFSVKDSYGVKDRDLNIQDFSFYLTKIKWQRMSHRFTPPKSFTAITCEYEGILVLKSGYDKYLPIIDGQINTNDIATNITITGSNFVKVSDIKNWILQANKQVNPL